MSIQQTSTRATNSGGSCCSSSSNPVVSNTSLSSENTSSSPSHLEPQGDPKEPLSPSKPSLPLAPGSISSRSSAHKSNNKKSVRFNQAVMARPSLHKNNYKAKEIAATWYSQNEFEDIRKDVLQTLALMRSGNLVEPEEDERQRRQLEKEGDDASTVASSDSNSGRSTTQRRVSFSAMPNRRSSGSYRSRSSKGTTNIYQSKRNKEKRVDTIRGLENYTAKGSIKSSIRKLRQNAVWAVMEEQDLQVDRAEVLQLNYLWYDDEAIREVYKKHSKAAHRSARLLGVSDSTLGGEPAVMPSRAGRRNSTTMVTKKTFRKLFAGKTTPSPSTVEDALIRKAAAAFSEKRTSGGKDSSSSRSSSNHHHKPRRWSMLGRRGSLSVEGPRSPAPQAA